MRSSSLKRLAKRVDELYSRVRPANGTKVLIKDGEHVILETADVTCEKLTIIQADLSLPKNPSSENSI